MQGQATRQASPPPAETASAPAIYAFDQPPDADAEVLRERLGGKGASLATMTALGLPVPPGFTIVTAECRRFFERGWSDALDREVEAALARLEGQTGKRFGDPAAPLLVSVRSGAAASMPGMMDTVLNVGVSEPTLRGLALSVGTWGFAADCRGRLAQTYQKAVGEAPPDDPRAQLRGAIEAVFRSWTGERAREYRRIEGLGEDAGTAVNVQAMVFGNLDDRSGTGVVFSRDPSTGEPRLYGDVLFRAQGEDVVAGTHRTADIGALAARLPDVAQALARHVAAIERHYRDLVEVEFTIEAGRLWILQARVGKRSPQAALRIAHDLAVDPDFPLSCAEAAARVGELIDAARLPSRAGPAPPVVGQGLAASPGVACGALVTSSAEAAQRAAAGRPVILVRPETSPSDVEGIAAAAGLLTARGGFASHAAVVARGWGRPAVVGVADLEVAADHIRIAGRRFEVGALLSLDGETGEVFDGGLAVENRSPPEAAVLAAWRDAHAPPGGSAGDAGLDDEALIVLLAIKGMATPSGLAEIMGCGPEALDARLAALQLYVDRPNATFVRPSPAGVVRAEAAIAAHAADLRSAAGVLDLFRPHNAAFKARVTDWQTRPTPAGRIPNDHADPAYDRAVIAAIGDGHARLSEWFAAIRPLGALAPFAVRLDRAIARVREGETAYLVSPRVDSYHNVWFELHEYLIRLAGRSRAEEEAAPP